MVNQKRIEQMKDFFEDVINMFLKTNVPWRKFVKKILHLISKEHLKKAMYKQLNKMLIGT